MKQVIHQLIDDLDGSEAVETVDFGLDGIRYEVDLNAKNAGKLRDALSKFIGAGQRTGKMGASGPTHRVGVSRSGESYSPKVPKEQRQAIRDWAAKQGIEVSDRGRIKQEIIDRFQEAHK